MESNPTMPTQDVTLRTNATMDPLRQEVDFLGKMLGEVIREFEGDASYEIVEQLRIASRDRRGGQPAAEQRVLQLIAGLDAKQARIAIRAFSVLLDLMNVVEDRRRVRVLAERARVVYPQPRRESIREAIGVLRQEGLSDHQIQQLIEDLQI